MPAKRTTRRLLATGILLTIAALAVVAYYALRPRAIGPGEAQEFIRAKNVALGHLENHDVEAAIEALAPIAARLPNEPLVVRNRAVAYVLNLGEDDQSAAEALVAQARQSLVALEQVEGQSAAWHWLSLRAALAASDWSLAQSHIDALVRLEPENAAARYAQFRLDQLAKPRELTPASLSALESARSLAPANAWLFVEWLRAKGRLLLAEASARPADAAVRADSLAELARQLDDARPVVLPFAHEIRLHTRHDVLTTLAEAAEAARAGNPQRAASQMLALANVLVPRTAQDRAAVRRHPLEFVVDRFRPEFYTEHRIVEDQPEPAIDVQFALFAQQVPAEMLEGLQPHDFAWIDFDLDGQLDFVALGAAGVQVWSRRGETWQSIAAAQIEGMQRLAVHDLDADFDETAVAFPRNSNQSPDEVCRSVDVDLILAGKEGVRVFENRFVPLTKTRELVLKETNLPQGTQFSLVECADIEGDGDLDLILAGADGISIWLNYGDWSFSDASDRSTLPETAKPAAQLLAVDFDRDVDVDVLVASPAEAGWLENMRHGQFRWRPFGRDWPELAHATALATLDANADASWDIVAADAQAVQLTLSRTPAAGLVQRAESRPIESFAAQDLAVWDYDNDGVEDVLAWSGQGAHIARGLGSGRFKDTSLLRDAISGPIVRAQVGDADNDGDLDAAILAEGQLKVFENRGGNRNHWIDIQLLAQQERGGELSPSGRSTPYGMGSLLELKAGSRYQSRVVRGPTTHFGLGAQPECDVVRVLWLNGIPQNVVEPATDRPICEEQLLMGSCPYLYAWNGERFEFISDLLWNAPIGLQLAEGQLAPSREWENLKISGRSLVPQDGRYRLQLTEELWEAAYLDQVRLLAIDHPADVEIYTNEKVGPPNLAEHKLHPVRRPRAPKAARNSAGRDLLPELTHADGIYAQSHERKLRQGLVEPHYFELDLGSFGPVEPKQITLFLTGWVYPAATSINVALSQGGSLAPPKPPSLLVPDEHGNWQVAQPFMGFPGGKTKTIAVDLSGLFKGGDHRVRIETSMEFYWDQAFFTTDEPPAEIRTAELALLSADLHARGFSRIVHDEQRGPEHFLYDEVSTAPKWPPMQGAFTRLGDVKALLAESDDLLLVMGAGDEVTLEFAVPEGRVPQGWTRDFVIHNVGWDKDCNLATVYGETVEPLPFRGMTSYPWPPDVQPPDSEAYRAYLARYQNRTQPGTFWKAIRDRTRP